MNFFFRPSGCCIAEAEQRKIEKMAEKGYGIKSVTARLIRFKKVKPEKQRAVVIRHDVGSPDYLSFVRSIHAQGYEYVMNDGVSCNYFVSSVPNAKAPSYDTESAISAVKRSVTLQVVLALVGTAIMLAVFFSNDTIFTSGLSGIGIPRLLFFLGWLMINLRWIYAVICEITNMRIIKGKKKPRRTYSAYALHIVLLLLAVLFIAASLIVFLIFDK